MPDLRNRLQAALGAKYHIVRELTGGGVDYAFELSGGARVEDFEA